MQCEALRRLDAQGDSVDVAAMAKARAGIEEGYRIYHHLQAALERVMVEVSRANWLNPQCVESGELRRRYRWYFEEIARACEEFSPQYRKAAKEVSLK